jgi:hypothetical protein
MLGNTALLSWMIWAEQANLTSRIASTYYKRRIYFNRVLMNSQRNNPVFQIPIYIFLK